MGSGANTDDRRYFKHVIPLPKTRATPSIFDFEPEESSELERPNQATISGNTGVPKGLRKDGRPPLVKLTAARLFRPPMVKFESFDDNTDCIMGNAFGRESLGLGNTQNKGEFLQKGAQKGLHSSRQLPSQSPASSTYSDPHIWENMESFSAKTMKESIYYPSRDDPDSVEICYKHIKCLDPQTPLTSPVMNFYIRYLHQQASSSRATFHFFNTFFYNKLRNVVSEQKNNKKNPFDKLRRWWKGVHLLQKAYILIPVNDMFHWSLVIICIPDKEESQPIVLHLDSSGLHCSRSIFQNITSFLKEECCYLDHEAGLSDLPISGYWKYLCDHIEEKVLEVPQQKNHYDCGLFVLLFMERFIEEAPERLQKKDLAVFGRHWFKPEEASILRSKIRKLLMEKFRNESSKK
ncbi:ubiquitin-like-specific protease 1D isoform X2 [Rosa chinensis]|uniref:ubiquitin-like-specific protease 1D isoform X2 n=1 Tax=Rosa chinensis TaxID=74649 RepID=UPI000D089DAD|nr:ubiquitin-like-specific protease 1D isoform X2 [Rosa chinensis]